MGYENLDGHAVREAFYSIKDLDAYGTGRKVTYTPEDDRGSPVMRIYEVRGRDVLPVTDWRNPPMLVPQKWKVYYEGRGDKETFEYCLSDLLE